MRVCIMLVRLSITSPGDGSTKTEELASKSNPYGRVAIYGHQCHNLLPARTSFLRLDLDFISCSRAKDICRFDARCCNIWSAYRSG